MSDVVDKVCEMKYIRPGERGPLKLVHCLAGTDMIMDDDLDSRLTQAYSWVVICDMRTC